MSVSRPQMVVACRQHASGQSHRGRVARRGRHRKMSCSDAGRFAKPGFISECSRKSPAKTRKPWSHFATPLIPGARTSSSGRKPGAKCGNWSPQKNKMSVIRVLPKVGRAWVCSGRAGRRPPARVRPPIAGACLQAMACPALQGHRLQAGSHDSNRAPPQSGRSCGARPNLDR